MGGRQLATPSLTARRARILLSLTMASADPPEASLFVTTAASGDPEEAEELQRRFPGLRAIPRNQRPIHELIKEAQPLLVLAKRRADLYDGGRSYRATVGMAFLRLLRQRKGQPDPLVTAAGLQPGDHVLDCTLGLGGDALVAAAVTQTRVLALEANPLLAAFTQASLRRLPGHGRDPAQLIDVRNLDHREFLRTTRKNFDVILFDPMFRRAGDAGPLFELLRRHAEHAPLDANTLQDARARARKGVLVKDAFPGHELRRLGLEPRLTRRSAAICFAWLKS